jgi:DNA repair protein SbcC/Rad50
MKLVKLAWRNICSYGNKLQEFTFSNEPELILVEGKNGSGKSSIKEALTISMYGKSAIRKTKDIPNRRNKNAYTCSEFVSSTGDLIKLERGIDPNFIDLTINGAPHNLPDKRKVDIFVEEELLNLPFSVFSNTISLSFEDFKSFIRLTPTDKRKIVDRIFGTDVLTEMANLVKDDAKTSKTSIEFLKSDIESNNETLEKSKEQLELLNSAITEEKDSDILAKETSMKEKKDSLEEINTQYKDILAKVKEIGNELTEASSTYAKDNATITEIDKKLKIYELNKCPHCLSDLTDDDHDKIKKAIESKREIFDKKVPELEKKIKDLKASKQDFTSKSDSYRSEASTINLEIISLQQAISELKTKDNSKQTQALQTIISNIEDKIKTANDKLNAATKKQEVFTDMLDFLSDNGIKQTLMNKIIPVLNSKILSISKKLDFKFSFEFNNQFDPFITHLGEEISPDSMSTGEQKKMNLIVLLAMLELIKMKNHQVNVLFLDEIFSSLDKESIYKTIEILKGFSNEHGLTIFVISHDPLPEELFNKKISIEKKNFFSEMTVTSATEVVES